MASKLTWKHVDFLLKTGPDEICEYWQRKIRLAKKVYKTPLDFYRALSRQSSKDALWDWAAREAVDYLDFHDCFWRPYWGSPGRVVPNSYPDVDEEGTPLRHVWRAYEEACDLNTLQWALIQVAKEREYGR